MDAVKSNDFSKDLDSVTFMETTWSPIRCCHGCKLSETDLGLNDVVAYLRNLPSAAADYDGLRGF